VRRGPDELTERPPTVTDALATFTRPARGAPRKPCGAISAT
jgi:hypothetical protein